MISFIYFDLGGVVIRDFSGTNKWQEMKRDIGINAKNEEAFDALWEKYRSRICVGFDVDKLIPLIGQECHIKLPKNYSMLNDFVNRFKKNPSIWPVLEKISKKYRIGLLTNAYLHMLDKIKVSGIMPSIKWDMVVDSCMVGFQKPDREIFEIAQEKAGAKGQEILFVENQQENIEAAKDFGWQTFFYDSTNPSDSSNRLLDLFSS